MTTNAVDKIDTDRLRRIVLDSLFMLDIEEGIELDDETLDFITKEVLEANVFFSTEVEITDVALPSTIKRKEIQTRSKTLYQLLSEKLISFGICSDEKQSLDFCQSIVDKWSDSDFLAEGFKEEILDQDEEDEEFIPPGHCLLCARCMPLTFHHLVPKATHRQMLKKKIFSKEQLGEGITICRPCHSAIHRLITNEVLAIEFNTLDKLLDNESLQKWIKYAEKQRTVRKDHAIKGLKYRK
ncbi:hypothetical protein K7432_012255 [Basidiobolus ranarum]|uniref:Uncharacterized protein n=1 Tax=Basidiobolus ranarum TaxID=34480 RepID=A0ABR2WL30_9FUNG